MRSHYLWFGAIAWMAVDVITNGDMTIGSVPAFVLIVASYFIAAAETD